MALVDSGIDYNHPDLVNNYVALGYDQGDRFVSETDVRLDVFPEEPLPPDSDLWDTPNVIITPHVSGYLPDFFARALELFADNLERFRAGRPLRNLVDKRLGYAPDWRADPKGPA